MLKVRPVFACSCAQDLVNKAKKKACPSCRHEFGAKVRPLLQQDDFCRHITATLALQLQGRACLPERTCQGLQPGMPACTVVGSATICVLRL